MKKLIRILRKSYNKQIDGTGLAIFRIVFLLNFLAEIIQLFYFRHLVFDRVPYVTVGAINPTIPLILWAIVIVFLIFGFCTRTMTIVNYVFTLVFIGTITTFEYHMFYTYVGINFLFMFIPVSRCLSIDRLILKAKYRSIDSSFVPSRSVSQINYFLPVLITLGFTYFDSSFFKLISPLWLNGLGLWLPASLPMVAKVDATAFLNIEWLVKFLGYLTILFEVAFIFLFWFKKFRVPLIIIGVGLHIGILIEFPIPYFALGMCSIYILMVPVAFWTKVGKMIFGPALKLKIGLLKQGLFRIIVKMGLEELYTYSVSNYRLPVTVVNNRVVQLLHNQIVNKFRFSLFLTGFFLLILFQLNVTYNSDVARLVREKTGFDNTIVGNLANRSSWKVLPVTKDLLGITSHAVFMDYHFKDYRQVIAVVYKDKDDNEIFLPINNKNGEPGSYSYGPNWVNWTFRVNRPGTLDSTDLLRGVRSFTAFWAYKNNIDLNDASFEILIKTIDDPFRWQKDFLEKQLDKKWIKAGALQWRNKRASLKIPVPIESVT